MDRDVEVNLTLAAVIFISALFTKILHGLKGTLSSLITDAIISESFQLKKLCDEIRRLKTEGESAKDLDQRVSLYNERTKKEECLANLKRLSESKLYKTRRICKIVLFFFIEGCRIGIIVANRTTPVFVFSPDVFWPLTRILSYPTGILGAISPVFWGFVCRQSLQVIFSLLGYSKR